MARKTGDKIDRVTDKFFTIEVLGVDAKWVPLLDGEGLPGVFAYFRARERVEGLVKAKNARPVRMSSVEKAAPPLD